MHIGIFGHYGNLNLGDEAIIEATIESVSRHFESPKISCFSIRPEDSAKRHGVPAFPIVLRTAPPSDAEEDIQDENQEEVNSTSASSAAPPPRRGLVTWLKSVPPLRYPYRALSACYGVLREVRAELPFLLESYRRLKDLDLLIVAGSNQFLDNFGGVAGFPLTLLKWAILCRMAGTKLAFVSVGAGPINSPMSKRLIRLAIRFADYLSYRDEASRDLIEGPSRKFWWEGLSGPGKQSKVFRRGKKRDESRKPIIGINPMPMYDSRYWCETDDGKYLAYVKKLARLSARLSEQGLTVFFFAPSRRTTT